MPKFRKVYLLFPIILIVMMQIIMVKSFPEEILLMQGEEYKMSSYWPFSVEVRGKKECNLSINGNQITKEFKKINIFKPVSLLSSQEEKVSLELQILGIWPLKEIVVDVIPQINVYPGGEAIGVLLQSKGVLVIDVSYILDEFNQKKFPARDAGIEKGDVVLSINGINIENKMDVAKIIDGCKGNPLAIEIQKGGGKGKKFFTTVNPCKNSNGLYMIGIYINDGIAGVGTLTFYEPKSLCYGALGHIITDNYTKYPVEVGSGKIVNAFISGISAGKKGFPGEKLGTFFDTDQVIGNITGNTPFGIYGVLEKPLQRRNNQTPIPVAPAWEVQCGAAHIYTVIQGDKIDKYTVEIEKVYKQQKPADKGMIIRIVDEKLLAATGGIIQGMSGSPIIQNGKLVGAVTHVFVNDPTRGYGIMAEWMVREANLPILLEEKKAS